VVLGVFVFDFDRGAFFLYLVSGSYRDEVEVGGGEDWPVVDEELVGFSFEALVDPAAGLLDVFDEVVEFGGEAGGLREDRSLVHAGRG